MERGRIWLQSERTRNGKEHDLPLVRQDAEAAARFYAATFPDSAVGAVHRAPSDYPSGKAGDVLTVEFTVAGIPCLGLNGGPAFKHSEAFSFQIATDDQHETDRYWNAIVGNGGQESACGWCKDNGPLLANHAARADRSDGAGGDEAKRAFDAMMAMKKIDVAAINRGRDGWKIRERPSRIAFDVVTAASNRDPTRTWCSRFRTRTLANF